MQQTIGDVVQRRYVRLINCMRDTCLLTAGEAISAIVDWKYFGIAEGFGAEAVAHLGGPRAAIRHAVTKRHFHQRSLRTRANG